MLTSIATLARYYAGVIKELEGKPRVPAEQAIRDAHEQRAGGRAHARGGLTGCRPGCGTHRTRMASDRSIGERDESAANRLYGRCWARTSDLRLVETALSQLS